MSGISQQRQIFIKEYRKDHNGTRAAIAAGYAGQSAAVTASRLLRNAKIRAEIDKQDAKLNEKLELSVEWVIRRLMRRANIDPRKFYNADGSLKSVTELDDDAAACLAGVEIEKLYQHFGKGQAQNTGTLTKIKYCDPDRSLEMLGRHLKMFTDKVELTGAEQLVARLQAARVRISA